MEDGGFRLEAVASSSPSRSSSMSGISSRSGISLTSFSFPAPLPSVRCIPPIPWVISPVPSRSGISRISPGFCKETSADFRPACVSTHSSPSPEVEAPEASAKERSRSASSSASVYASEVARRRQGTPRVTRYCLSGGRKSRILDLSPVSLDTITQTHSV